MQFTVGNYTNKWQACVIPTFLFNMSVEPILQSAADAAMELMTKDQMILTNSSAFMVGISILVLSNVGAGEKIQRSQSVHVCVNVG